jgi:UDP-GlcNAc:undecaprenyl-phosphate GlcNAc-1-phosphate transferase
MLGIIISLLVLNFLLIFYFNKLSRFINLFDIPNNKRKIHNHPIASIGGFLILINLVIYFFLVNYNFYINFNFNNNNIFDFYIFCLVAVFFFLIGYFDDKLNFNPNIKLFLSSSLIIITILVSENFLISNLKFSFIESTINLGFFSYPFSLLCILLFINAFNMFDGINLQSSIYSIHIFLMFILQDIFFDISVILILCLLFFSYLNLKNRCFLGNNGSILIAFVISYLFIKSQNSNNPFYADEIFLVMLIPGLDLLRLAIQRVIEKKHPFYPDKNHIHHLLLAQYGLYKTLLILLPLIIVPNILSSIFGYTLFYIIISIIIYIFIIFKFKKNIQSF